jgi:mannonate dehydratase
MSRLFLHIIKVKRGSKDVFRESEYLYGDNPAERIMEKLILLMQKRNLSLTIKPDHGFLHAIKEGNEQHPGYTLVWRLKGLAELRRLETGIGYKLKNLLVWI